MGNELQSTRLVKSQDDPRVGAAFPAPQKDVDDMLQRAQARGLLLLERATRGPDISWTPSADTPVLHSSIVVPSRGVAALPLLAPPEPRKSVHPIPRPLWGVALILAGLFGVVGLFIAVAIS